MRLPVPRPVRLLGVMLALGTAHPAGAQVFDMFSGLFGSVSSIAFYGQGGALIGEDDIQGNHGLVSGLGIETLLELPSPDGFEFELGLGTSVLRGFEASEPSLDLNGSIRTLPRISVYASTATRPDRTVVPYIGIGFGLAEMWNAAGYLPDGTARELTAEAYELSGTAGAAVVNGPLSGLYAEVGVQRRSFDGVVWSGSPLPPGWPRQFRASTVGVSFGWQLRLQRPEPPTGGAEE